MAARARALRMAPLIILAAVGGILAVLVYDAEVSADRARVRSAATFRAEWRADDIEHKLNDLERPARGMANLIGAQPAPDPALFRRFAERAGESIAPLRRLAWAPGLAENGSDSFPIEIEATFRGNRSLIGRDAATIGSRALINQVRDSGGPLFTLPMRFRDGSTGFVAFVPVYRDDAIPATVAERRRQLMGIVMASFELKAALSAAFDDTPPAPETISFFLGEVHPGAMPEATHSPDTIAVTAGGKPLAAAAAPGVIQITRRIDVGGQKWTLVSEFTPAELSPLDGSEEWTIPIGILLLTALLLALLAREQGYRRRVEDRVAERTTELRAANAALEREAEARHKTQEQLVQAQKMEAVGSLTGGMAHDFNNLLGIIIGNLDLLRDRENADPEAAELSGEALDAALRGADLTRRLLAFARRQPLQPRRVDVNEMVGSITTLLKRTLGEQIQIALDLGEAIWPIEVDPAQLESSLVNIATNAGHAMPNGGHLIIATSNRHLDEDYASQHAEVRSGDYALIEVSDTGAGMPPEIAARIFEPFFTTKEQGKGTGLGLSMVFGFLKQSGGHINVYSEPGIGTTFRLYLPRAEVGEAAAGLVAAPPLPHGRGERVLAVEDNTSLRRLVARQLTELGYRVVEAENAQEALKILDDQAIHLLFTDVVMPGGTSGYDLARAALARWPQIKVVLTSGFPDATLNGQATLTDFRLLSKPYRRDDLARAISEALTSGA